MDYVDLVIGYGCELWRFINVGWFNGNRFIILVVDVDRRGRWVCVEGSEKKGNF